MNFERVNGQEDAFAREIETAMLEKNVDRGRVQPVCSI